MNEPVDTVCSRFLLQYVEPMQLPHSTSHAVTWFEVETLSVRKLTCSSRGVLTLDGISYLSCWSFLSPRRCVESSSIALSAFTVHKKGTVKAIQK